MATKQNIECPLCRGEEVQPYQTMRELRGKHAPFAMELIKQLEKEYKLQ